MENNLLSFITFTPLLGALILALFLRGDDAAAQRNAKWLALGATVFTFLFSIGLLTGFDAQNTDFQFVEERTWLLGLTYKMGVDGISVLFVMLTTFLMPLVIAACWDVTHRVKDYMIALLILETLMIGVFCALDLILFYVFFEAGLIPMFLIIGIWGGKNRIDHASFKFFLYTLLGSVLMLVAMVAMYVDAGTTDIPTLLTHTFATESFSVLGIHVVGGLQTMMWLAFFASFAVKMPMWAGAHLVARRPRSSANSGLCRSGGDLAEKWGAMGSCGSHCPCSRWRQICSHTMVMWLSVIAIIYTSLVALVQDDMKKLIAYSSVAHMGYVTAGIFTANQQGIDGAIFQMISHGFVSGALFLCVGVIYDRMHTREIDAYGGLVNRMPAYALVFMLFTMANVGLPGTSGFIGEFLVLMGLFQYNTWIAMFATTGVILSACYALWLYRRVVWGDLIKESLKSITDMTMRERAIFAPLIVMTILFGVYPAPILDIIGPSVEALVADYQTATLVTDTVTAVAAASQ